MKIKKILTFIMSMAVTCSLLCYLTNINNARIHAVVIDSNIIESNNMDCTIERPDFVISENETLNVTDLQRHGLKVRRNVRIYDETAATKYKDLISRAENTPLYECRMIFPEKLVKGKNRVEIQSFSPFVYCNSIRCSLPINVTFSENSEKKDLRKRSETLFGDINGNEIVDVEDLVALSLFLLGDQSNLTAGQYMCADSNGDGQVNICDLAVLKQYIMNDDVDLGRKNKADEDIILVKIHVCGAFDYGCKGTIYDIEGNEYNFDFSDHYHFLTDDEVLDRIKTVYRTAKCNKDHKFNAPDMKYINDTIYKIDPEAEFEQMNYETCDFGVERLFGIKHNEDGTEELIKIYSYGDEMCAPTDLNADSLYKFYCQITGETDMRLYNNK